MAITAINGKWRFKIKHKGGVLRGPVRATKEEAIVDQERRRLELKKVGQEDLKPSRNGLTLREITTQCVDEWETKNKNTPKWLINKTYIMDLTVQRSRSD